MALTRLLCHPIQEAGSHVGKLGTLVNVIRHALPQLFQFLRIVSGKGRHPMPAITRPAGLRPVINKTAPAAKEPYISVFFQVIFPRPSELADEIAN